MRRWVILPGGFWKSDFTYYFGDENIAFFRYFNFFGWDTNLKFANLYIKKSKVIFFWYYYLQVILFKIIRKWSPKKNISNKKKCQDLKSLEFSHFDLFWHKIVKSENRNILYGAHDYSCWRCIWDTTYNSWKRTDLL